MAYFKATIDVLVECDNEAEACDALSEAIRPLLQTFNDQPSAWVDWRYHDLNSVPAPHDGCGFEYAGQPS